MPILMCGVRLRPSGYGATAFVWLAEPKLTLRHLQALAKAGAEERTRTFTVLPPPNGYAAANCCGSCERIVSRSELQPTPATTLFAQIRTWLTGSRVRLTGLSLAPLTVEWATTTEQLPVPR